MTLFWQQADLHGSVHFLSHLQHCGPFAAHSVFDLQLFSSCFCAIAGIENEAIVRNARPKIAFFMSIIFSVMSLKLSGTLFHRVLKHLFPAGFSYRTCINATGLILDMVLTIFKSIQFRG